jgi:hypothetical protein
MSINPVDLAAAAEGILNTQYLLQRERLLSASAQASRLLLEASDAMKAMPEVLRLLGEAAQVDRTALAFAEIGPNGEKWLKIKAEWISDTVQCHCDNEQGVAWKEPRADQFCSMPMAGQSGVFCPAAMPGYGGRRIPKLLSQQQQFTFHRGNRRRVALRRVVVDDDALERHRRAVGPRRSVLAQRRNRVGALPPRVVVDDQDRQLGGHRATCLATRSTRHSCSCRKRPRSFVRFWTTSFCCTGRSW